MTNTSDSKDGFFRVRDESGVSTLLYGFEESMLILDLSIKWLKSLIDPDPDSKIATVVVRYCPKAAVSRTTGQWSSSRMAQVSSLNSGSELFV